MEANPDKPWNWYWLSSNPSITFAIVEANPDKPWDWETLSENKFTKAKEEFEKRVSHQKFHSGKYIRRTSESIYASEANRNVVRYGI